MEIKRTRVGLRLGLPLIREMIPDLAVERVLGCDCSWLKNKSRRENMPPKNIARLNEATLIIGRQLAEVRIEYSTDRQAVIDQIREHLQNVKLRYVYGKHLGHSLEWWTYRTRRPYGNGYCYTLTEDEVLRINLAVADISARLLSIELVPDDEE